MRQRTRKQRRDASNDHEKKAHAGLIAFVVDLASEIAGSMALIRLLLASVGSYTVWDPYTLYMYRPAEITLLR